MFGFSFATLAQPLIIAHRGTTFWAPEETEAAMRWARNVGADYLEFDLQRTKDGYLIALHDDHLQRTTDVATKFPERKETNVSDFTYVELLTLDAGSWFNNANPARARKSFGGLDILTLEDVLRIAEGFQIKRKANGKRVMKKDKAGKWKTLYEKDPADHGNRPGIYVETKVPALFPGIELDLRNELEKLGWYQKEGSQTKKVILQTFSKESLARLKDTFVNPLPTCFLLWRGNEKDDVPSDSLADFEEWVRFGKENGATIIGASIGGGANHYADLLSAAHAVIIKRHGVQIHAYSFDTEAQMQHYVPLADGLFTNVTDMTLQFLKRPLGKSAEEVLGELGY
jgi:glycerophosphoryl diester phosphodiesterase